MALVHATYVPSFSSSVHSCDKGVAFEMPCVASLVFDVKLGTCVRPEQLSSEGKICAVDTAPKEIEGFTCPGAPEVGSQGLLNQHPLYPHPTGRTKFNRIYANMDRKGSHCAVFDTFR